MRIEQLESFIELSSSKSISIAAENLYISQPTLSRSIKLLEEELDVTLFVRSFEGVSLSDDGKVLLPIVQGILQQLNVLRQQAMLLHNATNESFHGQFHICTTQSVVDCIFTPAFEEMRHTFPSIEFIITVSNSPDFLVTNISEYDLFIGSNICDTFEDSLQYDSLQTMSIFFDSFSVVMNNQHPLSKHSILDISDLLDYKLITHSYNLSMERLSHKLLGKKSNNKSLDTLQSNNPRVILQLLSSSNCVLITNNLLVSTDYALHDNLAIIPLRHFKYHCFALFHPNDTQKNPIVLQLIEFLKNIRLNLSIKSDS